MRKKMAKEGQKQQASVDGLPVELVRCSLVSFKRALRMRTKMAKEGQKQQAIVDGLPVELVRCSLVSLKRALRMRKKMAKKGQKQQAVVDGLPVELVELILCRLPFPAVLKVRVLAKEWFYKFLPSSLEALDFSFPSLISSMSLAWDKYCPVISTEKDSFLCFDQTSFRWRRMTMFSNLPKEFHGSIAESCERGLSENESAIDKGGAFAFCGPMECFYSPSHYVMVCNTITKVWRRLPDLPEHPLTARWCLYPADPLPYVQMVPANSGTYKVILVYRLNFDTPQLSGISHIYDSKSGIWTEIICDQFSVGSEVISSVHMSGRLYCLVNPFKSVYIERTEDGIKLILQTYLVETNSWLKTIYLHLPWSHSFADRLKNMTDMNEKRKMWESDIHVWKCAIFKCKDKVVVVVWFYDGLYILPHVVDELDNRIGLLGNRHNTIQIYHLASENDLHECDFEKKLNRIERKMVLDWPQGTDDAAISDLNGYETIDKLFNSNIEFSADDNFIYVVAEQNDEDNNKPTIFPVLLAYHLETSTWSRIPSPPTNSGQEFCLGGLIFEPGLHPFMSP